MTLNNPPDKMKRNASMLMTWYKDRYVDLLLTSSSSPPISEVTGDFELTSIR